MSAARARRALAAAVLVTAMGWTAAHPVLLFGRVSTDPADAPAGQPVRVTVQLTDSARQEVPGLDMEIRLFDPETDPEALAAVGASEESGLPVLARVAITDEDDNGVYHGELPELAAGSYPFRLVELVDEEVESNSSGVLPVGAGEPIDMDLILPPVAAGVGTWLIWLVGLPLLAGVLVTVLVLSGKGKEAKA